MGLMNQAPTAARAAESPRRRGVGARLPRPYSVLIKAVTEWSVTAWDDGMIPPAFGLPPYQGGQGGSHMLPSLRGEAATLWHSAALCWRLWRTASREI